MGPDQMLGIASPIKGCGVEVPLLKNTFVRPKCLASCGCSVLIRTLFSRPFSHHSQIKGLGISAYTWHSLN